RSSRAMQRFSRPDSLDAANFQRIFAHPGVACWSTTGVLASTLQVHSPMWNVVGSRATPAWRAIRLFPILVLPALALGLDESWIYSSPYNVDAWLYYGIARNFRFWTTYFAHSYYWTRFSWTIPGAVAYGLFDPLTAKYTWHLSYFYVAAFALY